MIKRLALVIVLLLILGAPTLTIGAVQEQEEEFPPLTEPGPYGVRVTRISIIDESRVDWEIETSIFYPADKTQGRPFMAGSVILQDAPPDASGAPYPLVIYSHGWMGASTELMEDLAFLASQGYVVAAPQHHDTSPLRFELVDRPLDILTVLDELTAITTDDMAGMIDTEQVGLMGYSMGATTSLQMLGLLRDPVHFARWCAEQPDPAATDCVNPEWVYQWAAGQWSFEDIAAYRSQLGLQDMPDGSWEPFGDERVRAVLAWTPDFYPLTTEDMLTTVTTPTMIVHSTGDGVSEYEGNAVRTYTYLGTENRYLISLIDVDHLAVYNNPDILQHFETAFFGRYLKGDETYSPYLTPEHLPDWPFPRLVWGPYEAE